MVKKTVEFYDAILFELQDDGSRVQKHLTKEFWRRTLTEIEKVEDHHARVQIVNSIRYYGQVKRPTSPAVDHLQIGRLRDLSDNLEKTSLETGKVEPLELDSNSRVSEPTFIVPFGLPGRVAVMSPGQKTRPGAIADWIGKVLKYQKKRLELRLFPILNPQAVGEVLNAQGAVGLEFQIDAGTVLPEAADLPVIEAVDSVQQSGPSTGTLAVKWSLGRAGGTASDRQLLHRLAGWLLKHDVANHAKVNLELVGEDGTIKRDLRDLFEDHLTETAVWHATSDRRVPQGVLLDAIGKAIQDFQKRNVSSD